MIDDDGRFDPKECTGEDVFKPPKKDIWVQLALSMLLGTTAFLTFCVRHRVSQYIVLFHLLLIRQ